MGTFSASLRTIGDVRSLPATVQLSEGRLTISAGDTELGNWPLDEIAFEEIPQGYRLGVEGEQVLLEFRNAEAFAEELSNSKQKQRGFGLKRKKKTSSANQAEKGEEHDEPMRSDPSPTRVDVEEKPARVATEAIPAPKPKRQKKTKDRSGTGLPARVLDFVDDILIKSKKRWGAYLPDFMFSRAMFVILVAVLVLAVFFPGVFSTLLLIAGGLLVLFGAVVYSDSVLASRWLPGRATPQQALLLGLSVFLLGVLVGFIAK